MADHLSNDGIYLDVPENPQVSHDELIISLSEFFLALSDAPFSFNYQESGAPESFSIDAWCSFITRHKGASTQVSSRKNFSGSSSFGSMSRL